MSDVVEHLIAIDKARCAEITRLREALEAMPPSHWMPLPEPPDSIITDGGGHDMDDATCGEFTGYHHIKGTGSLRIEIDIPAERVSDALAMLGTPGNWVALARLDTEPKPAPKPKREWSDMTPTMQAGIRCSDARFWQFLRTIDPTVDGEEDAKTFLYGRCQVTSRRDIVPGSDAAKAWAALDADYERWLLAERYADYQKQGFPLEDQRR